MIVDLFLILNLKFGLEGFLCNFSSLWEDGDLKSLYPMEMYGSVRSNHCSWQLSFFWVVWDVYTIALGRILNWEMSLSSKLQKSGDCFKK